MSSLKMHVLSAAEMEKLDQKSMEIFENIGVQITHKETLDKFSQAGAKVDHSSQRVKIPTPLVRELLKQAPPFAPAGGLNGKTLNVGGDNRYYLSLILDPFILDFNDGLRRPVLEDVRRHAIIGESLDKVSAMERMEYPVMDVPEPDSYYKTMEVFLTHTTKHIFLAPTSIENCQWQMEIMQVIRDAAGYQNQEAPLASVMVAVTSPLHMSGLNIEILKLALANRFPVLGTVCPMAGTTAPYSLAGTTLISNVEALLVVLITQLYQPGFPAYYGYGPSVVDMHSGHDLYYGAEKCLFKLTATQLGQYYHLPVVGESGGSLTYRPDVQNGAESMAYMLAALAGGQNFICGLGSMHNACGMSGEQIIMHCGQIEMAEFLARGMDVSDHKLAMESIEKTGPAGNYLTDDLTLQLLRSNEFFTTPYFDMTGGYSESPGIYEIAHQRANELVNNYQTKVPANVRSAIKAYFYEKYQDKRISTFYSRMRN